MSKQKNIIQNIFIFLSIFTISFTVLPYFGMYNNTFDLISHFKFLTFFGSITVLVLALIFKIHKNIIIILFLAFFINLYDISGYFQNHSNQNLKPNLKILHTNVLSSNQDKQTIFTLIKEKSPDVIGFQEVDKKWKEEIEKQLPEYKYKYIIDRTDNFGIGLVSKIPFSKIDTLYFEKKPGAIPSITADIIVNEKKITLYYTHPIPPMSDEFFDSRNHQLFSIANKASKQENVIVFGDFNLTPWSQNFRHILKTAPLVHSSNKILGTWPSSLAVIQIPIDHFLHSSGISVIQAKKLRNIGSDHFPVFVEYFVK